MEKYYRILKLRRGATQIEIRNAYRKLAKKLHPDVNSSPTAKEDFIEINEAYEFLTDPDVRRKVRFKATPRARRTTRTAQHQQWNKEKREKAREKAKRYAQQKRAEFLKQKAREDRVFIPIQAVGLIFGFIILCVVPFNSILNEWNENKEGDNLESRSSLLITITLIWVVPIFLIIIYHTWHLIKFQIDATRKR